MSLTREIKEFALDLGYCKVGCHPYGDFGDFDRELASRGDMYDWYDGTVRQRLANNNPRDLSTFAKSVIVLAFDFSKTRYPENLVGKVGRVYQGRCYLPPEHRINGARIALFRDFLRERGCDCETDLWLPDRWVAARAGVTTYGKNTLAYVDGVGSFVILKSVVVDKELEYDDAPMTTRCPDGCRLCLDACPTQALYEPFKLNSKQCVAFNTFGRATPNGHVPRAIRDKMGCMVHGCDICQQVCPQNRKRLSQDFPRDPFLETLAADFSLRQLLHLTDDYYQARVQPIMYNYIRELWIFQRNAAIAIGNSGDESYVPDLIAELNHPEAAVRSHVAWALGRLGGAKARDALDARLAVEEDPVTREEIAAALDGGRP